MKIINPTDNEISIQFKGVVYTIPARGSISQVKEEVATYWKTMIHEFIQVSEDDVVSANSASSVKETAKEVKDEIAAEAKEVAQEVKKVVAKSKK